MFGFFKKDPVKKLEQEYKTIMAKAVNVQRSGDLRHYAVLIAESEEILKKIEELRGKA